LAVKWPTPTVCGNYNKAGLSAKSGDGLATAVKRWRTPNATDGAKWSNQSQQEREQKGQQVRLCHQLSAGGSLNPTWVEWLMGWPLGWTDLRPLETDKFQQWQQQHGDCSVSPESPARQDEPTTA
jgi:DNA (cytosine-5)-methyltransferase 1